MKNNNNVLAAVILISAIVLSASIVYLGTKAGCDGDEMKAAVVDGVAEYVEGENDEQTPPQDENVPEVAAPSAEALMDDDAVLGDADAPVTIVEFSDYQCPYCSKFYTGAYQDLKTNYIDTGKVKIVFRDFPLSFHAGAYPASLAAECVREQEGDEAYFEMHNMIFEDQGILGGDAGSVKDGLAGFATEVGVGDMDQYNECVDTDKYKEEIYADMADAQSVGISGTPSFVVGETVLVGAQPFEAFEDVIEAAL